MPSSASSLETVINWDFFLDLEWSRPNTEKRGLEDLARTLSGETVFFKLFFDADLVALFGTAPSPL